jgi:hypothetical protein
MLEFIVLGQIPGTQVQITFAWFLIAALGAIAYLLHKVKRDNSKPKTENQLSLFN